MGTRINLERISIAHQEGGFVYRNTSYFAGIEAPRDVLERTYIFDYPFPFRRPHSISLGAGGVAVVGGLHYDKAGDPYFPVFGDIIKSDNPMGSRNAHFSEAVPYIPETKIHPDDALRELPDLQEQALYIGVAKAIEAYAARPHFVFELAAALHEEQVDA